MSVMCRFLAIAGLALFGLSQQASAAVLYSQPYDGSGNFFASQNDTTGGNGKFATVFDNFILGSSATINQIGFTGGYFNGSPAAISGFTVTFYADSANAPGSSLHQEFVAGNASENLNGVTGSYTLAANFVALAGVQYWLSIVPDLGLPPQWGWGPGTGGDGNAFQDFFGSRSQVQNDFAFTLSGTPTVVPLPAALPLFATGLGALGLLGWRRKRKAQAAA